MDLIARVLHFAAVFLTVAASLAAGHPAHSQVSKAELFSHVTIGVTDLDEAVILWHETFGLDVNAALQGPDPSLSRLWNLEPEAIARHALLFPQDRTTAGLHLVEFKEPAAPVVKGAARVDWGPKSVVVYGKDMLQRFEELRSAGHSFGSPEWLEFAPSPQLTVREVRLQAGDNVNVMLVEHVGIDYGFGKKPFLGIGRLVSVVPDAKREADFYRQVLGLDLISEAAVSGPELEETFGYPPGTVLNVSVVGNSESPLGRIEAAERQGLPGDDLFPRAEPPAVGILHVTYKTSDLEAFISRLKSADLAFNAYGTIDTIYGSGRIISFQSPAGLRIEVMETGASEARNSQ